MRRIIVLFVIPISIICVSMFIGNTDRTGMMQIAQVEPSVTAEASPESCAHVTLGSLNSSEEGDEGYVDEDQLELEQMEAAEAEMYDEMKAAEEETGCDEGANGELINCTDETGNPLTGCVLTEDGYMTCDE